MSNHLNINSRITLHDGNTMPLFGLGVWAAQSGHETYDAVLYALKTGYRHIDTAEMYGNEKDVGNEIQKKYMQDLGLGIGCYLNDIQINEYHTPERDKFNEKETFWKDKLENVIQDLTLYQ